MKLSPEMTAKVLALAGEPKRVRRKAEAVGVIGSNAGSWSITLAVSCRVMSEANRRDHWTTKRRRAEIQREALARALRDAGLDSHACPLPVVVTWTRTGRQALDDDNLANAFKAMRDALAEWLGIDDGDTDAASWTYTQRVGEPGVEVTIRSRREGNG